MKVTRVLTSDKSGRTIQSGKAVSVRIRFEAPEGERAKVFKADLSQAEARELIKLIGARAPKGRKKGRRAQEAEAIEVAEAGAELGEGGEPEAEVEAEAAEEAVEAAA